MKNTKIKPLNSIWTDDQWDAICLNGQNMIISAGAGSGKTAVLTERILQKLIDGVLINQMIILTFTKAAAGEMRERIRKKIKNSIDKYPKLKNQLHLVDQADITTFDSFSLNLVKKYHYILGIPKNIGIIDNVQLDIEKKKILDVIINEMYFDDEFLKVLDIYTAKDDVPIKNAILTIFNKLDSVCKKQEYLKNYGKNFFNEDFYSSIIESYMNIIIKTSEVILMLIENLKIVASEEKYVEFVEKIEQNLIDLSYAKNYSQFKESIKDFKFPKMPAVKDADPFEKEQINGYKDKLKKYLQDFEKLVRYESIEFIIDEIKSTNETQSVFVKIISELDSRCSDFKKSINSYEFSDIMRLAIKLLEENKNICDEIRNNTNEIMIDEYQDTNDIGDYLVSLISNNNVYMVGDVKQSIYRFRNANPKLFMSKYNNYKKGIDGHAIDLAKNFRSREEVLDGINIIFEKIMDDDIGGANYLDGHTAIFGNKSYIKEGKTNQNYNLEIYNYDYKNYLLNKEFSKDEIEAFIIAKDIIEKIQNKEQIFDKDEKTFSNIKYKDIVILVDRKSKFELFKKIFDYLNIPLIIHKDEEFVYSNEIYVLKNILKLINCFKINDFSNFDYSFISVARSYIFDYHDNDIFSAITNKDALNNNIFSSLINSLKKMAELSKSISLSNLIIEIYNEFDFYYKSIKIGNIKNITNKLDHIIGVCKTLEETGYTLDDFIIYFDEIFNKKLDIQFSNKQDMSSNSVNIMTIHKSKGLEYPICYFPHFYKSFNKSDLKGRFLFDEKLGIIAPIFNDGLEPTILKKILEDNYTNEEISEKLRVLYVALTRAKEKMIIVNPIREIEKSSLPRGKNYTVNLLERQKYNSFQDIIVSLNEELLSYIVDKDIYADKLYLNKTNINYKKQLPINNIVYKTSILNLEKKEIQEATFSHKNNIIKKQNEMHMGILVHEILEYIDFNKFNVDDYEISDFLKYKIKKFMEQEFIKPGNRYYKEYAFYKDNKKGIIDLLIENKNELIVVDYKLKDIKPDYYEEQVKSYINYIKSVTNKKVTGYLYSILDEQLKKID